MSIKKIVTGQIVVPEKKRQARQLRREMTPPEKHLWQSLRANRLGGFHFRRQQIIDGYIVDFYCHAADMVIELDGPIHKGQKVYDERRQKYLESQGLTVLRFTNQQVLEDKDQVLTEILIALNRRF
ncbi:MAG: restriction endonuclease [Chloroflexi bacterium HGW-Chloroflexi-10]|nr:MAG: restriction endonuclease [Chloroflexi bacterium HGW-Chloroflexi-10]